MPSAEEILNDSLEVWQFFTKNKKNKVRLDIEKNSKVDYASGNRSYRY